MKIFLYICAAILLIGPIILWFLLSGMKCAYVNSSSCGVNLSDFLDKEFFTLYALPCVLGLISYYLARKHKAKS